ncbi:Ig-like domain-containing protein [Pseudoalteromonas distincta]|uniref:Ig-like domain-containing protein n=1 Tax=Pseudoalteromonas distincta TaxID=77608 RepID=UPI00321835FE
MEANQLVVIDIQGSAGVVLDDGSVRALNVGDIITVGDLVVTAIKSSLQIDVQGETLSIPANQKVKITPDLLAKEARDASETTVFDESLDEAIASLDLGTEQDSSTAANSDVTDFLDALEGDGDILDNLEATAAGGGNAAGADGGSSFVQLTRISESVDPSSVTFDSSFDQSATEAFNLRDTSDGIVPDATSASISLNELGVTNSSQPTITGTSENLIGETVNVTVTDIDGNSQVVSVVIGPDGTFEITLPTPVADGPVTVVVEATDPVGNPINDTISIEIDTTAPLIAIDPVADSASQTVTITGTVSGLNTGDNVSVTLTDSAGTVQTIVTQVDALGNWVITTTSPLSEGEFNVSAVAIDAAGNQAVDQALANIDLTAPVITVNVTDETNNVTPPLVGTTNGVPEGTQVTITVTDSAGQIQTLTAVIQADGSWSVEVETPLPEGDFTVDAQVSDSVGNSALASDSGVIDLSAPTVQINNINDTQDTTPTITGNAQDVPAGSIISVVITDFNGQAQTLLTQTNADGDWSIDVTTPLAEGQFEVDASVSDAAGNQAQANNQGVVDLTNPDITVTAIADTNDTTPTFVGRVEDAPAGSVITVLVTDINGSVQTLTTLLNGDGTWSVDANEILPGGEFTATASVTDAAGNEATAQTNGEITFAPISIQIDAIANTNDTTPFLSGNTGNVPAGTTITLTITASDGSTFTLLAVTQEDGSWTAQVTTPLPEGDFTVVAAVIDDSGNEAQASAVGNVDLTVSINFIIDTNDTTPTISGSTQDVEPGALVTVTFTGSDGVAETVQVVTGADGSWSVEASNELVEGQFSVVATVTDAAGNTASASETGEIDLTDPAITINPIEDTNDVTPSVSGNVIDVPAGTEVTLVITDSEGNEQTLTTITNTDGTYTADIIADLSEGDFTVTASVSDTAGNSSTATVTGSVDLTAPSVTINNIADTNDTTPILTGSTQGLASGSEVILIVTDSLGAEQQLVTTISADGTWSIEVPTALSEGDFTVTANVSDNAGNAAQDSQLGSVDTTPPLVAVNDFADSNDTTPTFSGTTSDVAPGSLVSVLVTDANGESQTLTAVVSEDGTWQVGATQAVAEGDFTITATVTDAAGNEASDTGTGTIDLSAPIIAINTIPDSADTTPTISGSVQNVPAGTTVTLTLTDAGGNTQTITTQTLADGSWTADAINELVEGDFSVNAIVSDEAGNQSETSAQGTIDNTAPTITIDALADSNDTTPTISGTATGEPEGTVVTITVTDEAGNPQTITTEVLADGTYTVDVPDELSEGEYSVDVSITDTAGNVSTEVTTGTIDTSAPAITIDPLANSNDTTPTISGTATGEPEGTVVTITVTDDAGNPQTITTEVQADGTFSVDVPNELSEGEFTVEVSVTDTAGNETTATTTGEVDTAAPTIIIDPVGDTNNTTPTISGTATGEPEGTVVTITVTDDAGNPQTITTEVQADGTFSVDVPNELSEGEFTVEVSVTDTAGNETTATTTGEVDTAAPSVIIDPVGDTNDTTPTISGTATGEPEGTVVTITVTDDAGNPQTITTEVQADGTFSVDVPNELSEGEFTVEVSVTDTAGNETTATATGEVDTTAPIVTINALGDTSDTTPTISGTVSGETAGSTITLTMTDANGAVQTITAQVIADGSWTAEVSAALAEGTYSVDASISDSAGNEGTASALGTIDTSALTITIDIIGETNDQTPQINGDTFNAQVGTSVEVQITDSAGATITLTTVVDENGLWSVTPPVDLAEGTILISATVTDIGGGTASAELDAVIDITPPTIQVNELETSNDTTPVISGNTTDVVAGTVINLTVTDSQGVVRTFSTTTDVEGNWSIELSQELASGDYSVEAEVSDAAGNSASDTATGNIDTSGPSLTVDFDTVTNDSTPTISGTSDAEVGTSITVVITDENGVEQTLTTTVDTNGNWEVTPQTDLNEGDNTIEVSVSDEAGNTTTVTDTITLDTQAPTLTIQTVGDVNDLTPTLQGTSNEIGGTVTLIITDSEGAVQTITTTVESDGHWDIEIPSALAQGDFTVTASITDAAGNDTTANSSGNVDTITPVITVDALGLGNDSTPVISGTSTEPEGTVVNIVITDSNGDETPITATVDANGNWQATSPELPEGSYSVQASITDAAGNTDSAVQSGTIDSLAPTLVLDTVGATNDSTPTISGSTNAPAGTVISISVSDGTTTQTFTATVQADGSWSADVPNALSDGELAIEASVSDNAGNTTTLSETATLNTTAPSISINALLDTNDTTPTINGTSDAADGTIISLTFEDSAGNITTVDTTVTGGVWSIDAPTDLAEGEYTVTAEVDDGLGNIGSAAETGEIDLTAPSLVIADNDVSNDTTPTISGTSDAPQGSEVTIIVTDSAGAQQTITATVGASGAWSAPATIALAEGNFTVSASVSDAAGNEATATGTGEIDTIAPTLVLTSPGSSNDITPTLSGTSDAVEGTVINFTVVDDLGSSQTFTTTVDADGNFSIEVPTALAEGPYTITANISDVAGNSTNITGNGTIDTTAPSVSVDAPVLTNDSTPTVTGTSDAPNSTITVTFTDAANATQSIDVQTDTNGNWSATPTDILAEGNYSVSASITDAAGNTGTGTDSGEVDVTPPDLAFTPTFLLGSLVLLNGTSDLPAGSEITITEQLVGGGVGLSYTTTTDANGNWSLTGIDISLLNLGSVIATATDAAGNTRTISSDDFDNTPPTLTVDVAAQSDSNTPVISGTSDAGEGAQVTIVVTDSAGNPQTITALVDANGDWSATPTTPLSEGQSTIEVSVRDSVGNETTVSDTTTIDTQAPTLTIQNVGDVSDLTPELQGTSNEIGGTVTLIITDSDGAVQTIDTIVGSDGHWSIEVSTALAQGDFSVVASITDAAGNESTANSSGNVDTITPIVTVDVLGLGNDSTPTVSGTSTEPAGTVINIVITDSNDDEHPITATVDANGDWQATSPELPDGSYSVQASITDDAGNTGGATQSGTLDTLAPTLTLDTVGATNDSTPTISGSSNAPAGTVISISVSDGTTTETFTATVQTDGSWSADVPNALTDGPLTIEASVEDVAGNTTTLSETATLNTTAPSISINTLVDTNDTTPTINGTSDGADDTIISLTFEDSTGNITTVDTTVTGGVWSVDAPTDLAEGEYTVTATVNDGLGNIGSATETGQIDLTGPSLVITDNGVGNDTTPTITGTSDAPQGSTVTVIVTDSAGAQQTITATVGASGAWSVPATTALAEGNFTVSASVSDTAGNEATATGTGEIDTTAPTLVLTSPGSSNDITPTLSGSSDAVEGTEITFTIVDDQGNTQTFTTTVDADGTFSVEVPTALAEGPYSIEASISDVAGNSTDITGNGTIDTAAPSITVDAAVLTNDSTPTVTGTSDAPNSTITVTFTDAANAIQSIDVQTDVNGNWSATPTGILAEGNYSVSASITDAAGNTGTGTDSGEVDVTPPALAFTPTFELGLLITLSGTSDLPAGSEITITEQLVGGGIGATYTATTDADGNWSLVGLDVSLLDVGSVIATATDAAGNTRTISSDDFDNTPPTLTVDVAAQSDSNTPVISGTSDAGEGAQVTIVVTDSDGNPQTITALVDANGNWSATPATPLSEGESTIEVSVRDSVGNETTVSDTTTIDTQAPTLTIQNVGDVSDLTPELQGTSNEIGGTVTLIITDSAGTVQTIDTIVGSDGHWSIEVSTALAQGDFSVVASITDAAGNESTANSSGNVDTITPIVTVDALGLGNDSTPVVSGTSTEPEGTVVNIVITDSNGDEHPITATVDANGDWQATSPELPDGSYSVQASITDDAGNTGGATQTGNLDTLAPTLTLDTVGATNDSTPTISGTSNAPAGTVITINVTDADNTETFIATVQADGSWSADVPNALTDGPLTIEASVSDSAGNTTTLSEGATLDTNAPSINIDALMDTNDTTPNVSGTSSAANGTIITVSFTDSNDITNTVQTTVTDGIWSVEAPVDLAEGSYEVEASVTDGSGNTSTATGSGIVDTTIPNIAVNDVTVTDDTTPTITGTANAPQGSTVSVEITDSNNITHTVTTTLGVNGTWSVAATQVLAEGTFTVSASVSDAAGNEATATGTGEIDTTAPTLVLTSPGSSNDITPTLSGTSDAVEGTEITFTIVDDQGNPQTFTTTVDADGNFSVEVPTALAEGPYSIEASISDVAGNSTDITGNGTIDTAAPSITVDAAVLTNDSTPTVTGTSDAPNSTITVTFTDAANAIQSIDVQTDVNGNWSATPTGTLAEGNYSVSASITDAAGNTGTGTDNGELDVTAPELEIIPSFLLGNLVSLSGDSDLPGGSVITITEYLVGGLVGATYTATTNPDGTWGLANITVPLLSLAYVTASASDAAGNVRTINTLDFDNVAPELTVSVDALSNDSTPVISGTTDMGQGTVINMTVTDSAGQSQEFTAIVQAGGGWSVAVPAELAQGQYTVVAEVRDSVGNLTTQQAQGEIDSVDPTLIVNEVNATIDTTPTISGTSNEIGADVSIIIGGQTLTATVGTDGNWQVDVPVALVDGDYTAQVSITDDANNISSTTIDLTIDTQVPVIVLNDITVFNTNTPIVSGTSTEPQNTVVDIVITDKNGDIHTLTAIVDASGDWQVTAPSLPDGNYDVEVSITDDAGNQGVDTGSSFIDTQAPSITINALGTINDSTPTISGTSNELENTSITVTVTDGDSTETYTTVVGAGGAWSVDITDALTDGEVIVSAAIVDTAGNSASANATATLNTNAPTININTIVDTNDQTPAISGTSSAADNTEITVVITDVNNVSHTVTTSVVGGIWGVDATSILPEGEFTVSASVTEGGLTSNATGSGVIDLTAPALSITPLVTLNDTTPTISGTTTAPQGALVIILITDSLGAEQTVNATVGANGTWSVAASTELSEGAYTVSASTTDTAGNPVNTSTTGGVDITAPVVTINNIVGSTDLTPGISGSVTGAMVGDAVAVVFTDALGNKHTVNTTVQTGGVWSVEASSPLSQGDYSVEASVTDSAGNTGDATNTATIDTIAPEISINQSSLVLTQDNTPLISGTSNEANTNVVVTFTDSAGVSHQITVQTDVNGDWQVAANNILADGVYSVSATISDAAGNTSVDNKTGGEVDTVGPELTIVPSFLLGQLVSLSGTSDLGEGKTVTVTLELAGDLLDLTYDVTTDANGDWELLGLAVNVIGLSVVEASATDDAGNTTTITTADVDASTPVLNAVVDFVTGEGDLPIISGTTDQAPGTEVLVRVVDSENVVQELTAIVQDDNTWAVQVPQSLAEGTFSVTVDVLSEVGITTTQLLTAVVDTISPTLGLQVIGTTSDSTPIIQGTSDLINGVVEIQLDGGTVLTTTVDALGIFTLEVDALSEGQHVANVSITDDAGNVVTDTLEFVVDTLVPVVDILPLTISDTDILTISGSSEEPEGTDIDVTVIGSNGDETVFDAVVGSDGTWSLVTTSLSDGVYDVYASITDAAGNTGQSAIEQVTIDTIPPVLVIDAFGVLNTLTPTITGSSDEEVGSLITVNITDSTAAVQTVTTTVLGDGTWSVIASLLPEGEITVEAISTDSAGNEATATQTGTISTTLPGLLINQIVDTSDTTPTITGTTDVLAGDVQVVITDSSGTATTYNTTAIAGEWTLIPTTPLAEGAFTVSATVENLGLTSSTSLGGIIDLTPPTVEVNQLPVTNNPLPTITGTSDAPAGTNVSVVITDANNDSQTITAQVSGNGTWSVTATTALSEGSFNATASISDTAGNSASDTMVSSTDYTAPTVVIDPILVGQDITPTVTGSVTGSFAGALVIAMFTDSAGATHNVQTTVGADGTWSVISAEVLSEGNYTVDVGIADGAGNTGEESASSTVDNTAPVVTIDSGLVLTADSTPEITGTAGTGDTVVVTILGYPAFKVVADEFGHWSLTPNGALTDGVYTVTATVTDTAGNIGSSGSISGLVVDTTPPTVNDFEVDYLLASITGIKLAVIGFHGTTDAEPGTTVTLDNSLLLGISVGNETTTVQSDGSWAFTSVDIDLLALIGNGLRDVRIIFEDLAGNTTTIDGEGTEVASTSAADSASGDTIPESFSEESSLGDTTPNEVSSSNVLSTETIDLGNLSGLSTPEQTVQMSSAEPLNINDVIISEDAEQLIALNTLVEDEGSAIAYTPAQSGGSIDAAAPAVDVQNQSEEMIKHLIESSNNQTDI